jgi:tetratricopeptide (TPR) repeat protein
VRITAQLIEAQSGNHVWAERFDRPLEDVFEVQDEITALVASTVGRQVTIAEYRATRDRAVQDLDYRGLLHRAMWYMDKVTAEDCVKAREYAQQALDRYPNYSGGYSLMAYVSIIELIFGWGGDRRAQLFPEATEYATKGISLDPDDELAHATMGDIYWLSGDHDAAIKEGETILQLNSNFPFGYGLIGSVHACSGSTYYQQAVENLEHAIRLSPNDPWLQFYFSFRGLAEFFNQNYDEAINWFQRSIQRNSNSAAPRCRLAAALALKGELEKAKAALGDAVRCIVMSRTSKPMHRRCDWRGCLKNRSWFSTKGRNSNVWKGFRAAYLIPLCVSFPDKRRLYLNPRRRKTANSGRSLRHFVRLLYTHNCHFLS